MPDEFLENTSGEGQASAQNGASSAQNYREQPPSQSRSGAKNENTRTEVFKGDYDSLLAKAEGLRPGVVAANDREYVKDWKLQRTVAGVATLTILYSTAAGGGNDVPSLLAERWAVRHAQVTKPLSCFCGPSASQASWGRLSAWSREPDTVLWEADQYRLPSGAVASLTEADKRLSAKMKMGIESVMKFYPVVQKISIYSAGDSQSIDGYSGDGIGKKCSPGKFSGIAAAWLKTGDDLVENAEGTWTRTESWQGADAIDDDLYGDSAWTPGSL